MSVNKTIYAILASLMLLSPAVAEDQLDESSRKLFRIQLELANSGNPQGQFYVGRMYEQGLGTEQDLDKALSWYLRSSQQGFSAAKLRLKLLEKERRRDLKEEKEKQEYLRLQRARQLALKRKLEAEERKKAKELELRKERERKLAEQKAAAEMKKQAAADAREKESTEKEADDALASCLGPKTKFMSNCR